MVAEDIIIILRQQPVAKPLCWMMCYEDRPLQGLPPGGREPHLLIFCSPARAEAFSAGRRRYFAPEPLSVVGIDSAATLRGLTINPARDLNYEPPPFGLLLNFTYPAGATDKTLTPQQIAGMDSDGVAQALGLAPALPPPMVTPAPAPVAAVPAARPRSPAWVWVLGLMAVVVGLFCLGVGAALWFGRESMPQVAALFASATPTFSVTPTLTSTPTATPAPTLTFTPTASLTRTATLTPPPIPTATPGLLPAGTPIYQQSFDNVSRAWETYYTGTRGWLANGQYHLKGNRPGYVGVAWYTGQSFEDSYYYQADMVLTEASNIPYGLLFDADHNNNYYIFEIDADGGTYAVFKLVNDEWATLIDWTYSAAIRPHPQWNTLGVYFKKGRMDLYLNADKIDSYSDLTPFNSGRIGILVADAGVELLADNALVYRTPPTKASTQPGGAPQAACPNGAPPGTWALTVNKGGGDGTITLDGQNTAVHAGQNVFYLSAGVDHVVLVGSNTLTFTVPECGSNTVNMP